MTAGRNGFVAAGGHRLEYAWLGASPPQATALVFLHQGLGSVSTWGDYPAAVAQAIGLPALIYSRWGHGRSAPLDGPRTPGFMHDEALVTLPELLSAFGIERPVVIGHSDGASMAIIHAGARPGAPRALVLEAPHVFLEAVGEVGLTNLVRQYETTDMPAKLARHHGDNADRLFRAWSGVWRDPATRSWNIESSLPSIRCPVLVIQGKDDEFGTLAQVEAIAARVAGPVETLVLPGCGHTPHRDRRDEVLARVFEFLTRLAHEGKDKH